MYMTADDGAKSAGKKNDKAGNNATHFATWIGIENAARLKV
jgi:hypothetical protein